MKKFLLLAILVAAAYKFFPHSFPFLSTPSAFDKSGKPMVVVFLGPNCAGPCDSVQNLLKERGISYQALKGNGYPLTYVGFRRFSGYNEQEILAAIAELKKTNPGKAG